VLFADARLKEDYDAGHIAGAVHLDIEGDRNLFDTQIADFVRNVDPQTHIITYCAGAECDASLMLARYLRYDLGYEFVSIYFGGWEFWKQNGLPIDSL